MSRLLTTLFLYKQHYTVCQFISLERLIEKTKESYYETLHVSSQGWHTGTHNALPFAEYLLGVVLAAYQELEGRVETIAGVAGAKTQMVLSAIREIKGAFTFAELGRACPLVSDPMLRNVLNDLRAQGKIKSIGRGRAARWQSAEI